MTKELLSPRICYRLNIIGDHRSGKTTLFKNGQESKLDYLQTTLSPEIECRSHEYNNELYCFIITDTPGHTSFNRMNEFYYDNYDCLIIVVDLSNEKNFLNLPFLIDKIKSVNIAYNSNEKTIVLVGNTRGRQCVLDTDIEGFAKQHSFFYFKFNPSDDLFLTKIFQLVIENKKNGKQKNRQQCFQRLIGCWGSSS